jgi:hypothetical protein
MWYCSIAANSLSKCCAVPAASWRFKWLLARTISISLCVRSSSQRADESIMTLGRTGGGGTGRFVTSIQSGRV